MDPGRFRQLIDIVGEAVEQPVDVRAAWVARQCGTDAELLVEALSLLSQSDPVGDAALTTPLRAEVVRASADLLVHDRAGERAGAYRLTAIIGHGGMGTVYLAERADDEYRARVAIKFVRGRLAAPELERRFRAERQILADLNHPNIARLLDGGTAADGTPFLVMEYLDGVAIDEWCDTRGLGVHQRVRLFLQVCGAVDHAHRAGVIHRDLKPANILVTPDGTPKLVDFGIARLLDEGGSAEQTTMFRALTPTYASPEQIRGLPVTVATDIYSLGVVLYELLAGRPPFELSAATAGEVERLICHVRPSPPSEAAAAARSVTWCRDVALLDDSVLHALRKEPADRPATVDALASTLEPLLELTARQRRAAAVRFVLRGVARRPAVRASAALLVLAMAFVMFGRGHAFAPVPRLGAFDYAPVQQAPARIPLPYDVYAADVNGNGRGDLIWNHLVSGSNVTYVGLADHNGSFALQEIFSHPAAPPEGWHAYALLTGDFDGDGRADLLWHRVAGAGANRLYVALSNGDGSFHVLAPQTLGPTLWAAGWKAFVGDIDGDGTDDVVFNYVAGENNITYVAWSRGAGRFVLDARVPHRAANWSGYRAFVADADGDGRADIIWNDVPTYANRTYVARSRGVSFDLLSWQDHEIGSSGPAGRAWAAFTTLVGDIDGDRRADLVWIELAHDPIVIHRALGQASAKFRYLPPLALPRPADADSLAAQLGDFNGDGRADLLLRDQTGRIWIALAERAGRFRSTYVRAGHVADGVAGDIVLLDVDGDGRTDIVWNERGATNLIRAALAR
jgi:tRNA A-37 threonylcarbamoyl transferase component Bud32